MMRSVGGLFPGDVILIVYVSFLANVLQMGFQHVAILNSYRPLAGWEAWYSQDPSLKDPGHEQPDVCNHLLKQRLFFYVCYRVQKHKSPEEIQMVETWVSRMINNKEYQVCAPCRRIYILLINPSNSCNYAYRSKASSKSTPDLKN